MNAPFRAIVLLLATALVPAAALCGQASAPAPEEVEVHGTVVDAAGRPLAGVGAVLGLQRELFTVDALQRPAARTDQKGRFSFKTARIQYRTSGTEPRFVLLAKAGYATARATVNIRGGYYYTPWGVLPPGSGDGYDLGRITLLRAGRLAGRVRGKGGRPLAGARVVASELLKSGYYARFNNYGYRRPAFSSAARTDADGRFVLDGVFPEGLALTVHASGYYVKHLPFASSRRVVDVTMEESGFVEGRVVDGDDKPVAAMLYPQYETVGHVYGQVTRMLRTDKDGKFRMSIDSRGRFMFRAVAITLPGQMYRSVNSSSYSRPRKDIVIELSQPADAKKPITVEVVDKKTGKPVTGARAVVLWQDQRYVNTMVLENAFRGSSARADKSGKIRLPGPRAQQPPSGGVLVKAEGYAPAVRKKIEYDEEKIPKIKVEMEVESAASGVVVDEKTGKPLAGVRVTISEAGLDLNAMRYMYGYSYGAGSREAISDENGVFRVGGLRPGKYELKAMLEDRPASKVTRVTLEKCKELGSIRITSPIGVALSGKVFSGFDDKDAPKPARLEGDWHVRLGSSQRSNYYDPWGFSGSYFRSGSSSGQQLSAGPVPLAADGSFRFEGLGPGRGRFYLLAPPIGKRGRPAAASIEPLRVRRVDMKRDFDISEDLPGIVRGKVKVTGLAFPMSRLFVLSVPVGSSKTRPTRVYFNQGYFRCIVDEDGTFAFRASRGRHHVYVMDGAYSTVLHHAPKLVEIDYGKTATLDMEIPIARVRVRLRPEKQGATVAVGRLAWKAVHPGDQEDTNFGRYNQGYGCLVEGRTELFLELPPVKTRFFASRQTYSIDPTGGHQYGPCGEGEVLPKVGQLQTLEIVVTTPPDVSNAAEEEDAERTARKAEAKKKPAAGAKLGATAGEARGDR